MAKFITESGADPSRRAPLRLLHIVNRLSLSGMEYGVIKLVNRLDQSRFAPMICCLRSQREETRSLVREGIPVFELHKKEGWDWSLAWRLARLLREQKVDVMHSHNWPTFAYTVLAAVRAGGVVTLHGEHGRETKSSHWKRTMASRWLTRCVDRVTAVSRTLMRELAEEWGIPAHRITAVPNGVELDLFVDSHDRSQLRMKLSLTPDHRIIIIIGRIRPVKDHATLLRAFARVHKCIPQARLLVVGADYGTSTKSELVPLAQRLGIASATRFLGMSSDIPQLLELSDVYVNSSEFEGMSNTILEAMAAGKPVVATRVGGNPELVQEGKTGYLVPVGDDRAMGARLRELLNDALLSSQMGREARRHVERHHTMTQMVRGYSQLYEECAWLKQRRATAHGTGTRKRWLAGALRWTGLTHVRSWLSPPSLAILTYHRVLPLPAALDTPFHAMVMPRDQFEAQMSHISRTCQVFSLQEAVRRLQEGSLPRRAVAVTFDDGYADNYEHAWPVLEKYGVPATFFLVTGAIDRQVTLWWEEVGEIVHAVASGQVHSPGRAMRGPDWMEVILREVQAGEDPRRAARTIVDRMNELPTEDQSAALEALRTYNGTAGDKALKMMLTWDQVKEMESRGMSFGAHTISHAFLDEVNEDMVREEIERSVETLKRQLEKPVQYFSYPRGRMSQSARRCLDRTGVKVAVTTVFGCNRTGTDLLELKRLESGYYRSRVGFDVAVFEAELQGWFENLRSG